MWKYVIFVILAIKTVMVTKKVILLPSQHTKGILMIFYAFFTERELFFFEIISC